MKKKHIRLGLGSLLLLLAIRSVLVVSDFITGPFLLILSIAVFKNVDYDNEWRRYDRCNNW